MYSMVVLHVYFQEIRAFTLRKADRRFQISGSCKHQDHTNLKCGTPHWELVAEITPIAVIPKTKGGENPPLPLLFLVLLSMCSKPVVIGCDLG